MEVIFYYYYVYCNWIQGFCVKLRIYMYIVTDIITDQVQSFLMFLCNQKKFFLYKYLSWKISTIPDFFFLSYLKLFSYYIILEFFLYSFTVNLFQSFPFIDLIFEIYFLLLWSFHHYHSSYSLLLVNIGRKIRTLKKKKIFIGNKKFKKR